MCLLHYYSGLQDCADQLTKKQEPGLPSSSYADEPEILNNLTADTAGVSDAPVSESGFTIGAEAAPENDSDGSAEWQHVFV